MPKVPSKVLERVVVDESIAAPVVEPIFIAKPGRTLEWFGGVSYENLESKLSSIKKLLIDDSLEEIHLFVNSFGGTTGIGMSFYDAMHSMYKPNLVTIGSGDVDSSGIIVFLSGKKRFMTRNTTMLFHLAGRTFGYDRRFTTIDMENMLREDRLKDFQYASVVSEATGGKLSTERVLDMMMKNTILTPEEAVQMGIAHKVL
ncbi:ATP-dependent Clp protease proteolytic subunit [Candidatus Parcubacteria bacterium]|nr:ATP-dependent Clp protease proteolytic subunit [Candidatus Parcubacteria bacterium]